MLLTVISIIVFIVILSVLVLIHEAGHYFMGKFFGIKVEEFGIGLPPRAYGVKKGETIYSVNWLPIGGFVKLYGEDEAGAGRVTSAETKLPKSKDSDYNRAFFSRSVTQRAIVVVAGVVMNALLAAAIFYVYFLISNFQSSVPMIVGNYNFLFVNQQNVNTTDTSPVVTTLVSDHSPASAIGLTDNSELLSINNRSITSRTNFVKTVNQNKGKRISLNWKNLDDNSMHTATVIPRLHPPKDQGSLGVAFLPTALLHYETPSQKIFSGFTHPINLMIYTFYVLGKLIGISVQQHNIAPVGESVSGPVGIGVAVNSILQLPKLKEIILQLLNLAGLLSASLAVFNILPIPALDGGRFFFILIEGITRKKVNPKIEERAHAIGMMVLIGLIVVITIHEIFFYFF